MKDLQKIEDLLRGFKRKPVPPEIKEKILRLASQETVQMRPLVNSFRRVAAVCSALIVVVFFLETKISEDQVRRISVLQNTSFESETLELNSDLTIIFEPLDEAHDSRYVSWIKNRYFREKRTAKRPKKKRDFNMFMEDLNGS